MILLSSSLVAQKAIGHGYAFEGNGKNVHAKVRQSLYSLEPIDTKKIVYEKKALIQAISHNQRYLKRGKNRTKKVGNLSVSTSHLKQSTQKLQKWMQHPSHAINDYFKPYLIKGEDSRGNLHYTGYYVPVLHLTKHKDKTHIYPLYKQPKRWKSKTPPTRKQIDKYGALKNQGLELGWSDSLIQNYFLHVQGSGFVKYEDGALLTLAYGGKNSHTYKSIGKALIKQGEISKENISLDAIASWAEQNPKKLPELLYSNPSYTFFTPTKRAPYGAANVTLTPKYSVAVDSRYIPLGAVLVGEVPVLDKRGKLLRHEYRILFAHDQGAAIKGSGHVDIYQGVGKDAKARASHLHHYGRLWILLPK